MAPTPTVTDDDDAAARGAAAPAGAEDWFSKLAEEDEAEDPPDDGDSGAGGGGDSKSGGVQLFEGMKPLKPRHVGKHDIPPEQYGKPKPVHKMEPEEKVKIAGRLQRHFGGKFNSPKPTGPAITEEAVNDYVKGYEPGQFTPASVPVWMQQAVTNTNHPDEHKQLIAMSKVLKKNGLTVDELNKQVIAENENAMMREAEIIAKENAALAKKKAAVVAGAVANLSL